MNLNSSVQASWFLVLNGDHDHETQNSLSQIISISIFKWKEWGIDKTEMLEVHLNVEKVRHLKGLKSISKEGKGDAWVFGRCMYTMARNKSLFLLTMSCSQICSKVILAKRMIKKKKAPSWKAGDYFQFEMLHLLLHVFFSNSLDNLLLATQHSSIA